MDVGASFEIVNVCGVWSWSSDVCATVKQRKFPISGLVKALRGHDVARNSAKELSQLVPRD